MLADSEAVHALIEARETATRGDVIRGLDAVRSLLDGPSMSGPADPYEIPIAPPARRAIGNKLPPDVAAAAVDFITGPLLDNPYRVSTTSTLN